MDLRTVTAVASTSAWCAAGIGAPYAAFSPSSLSARVTPSLGAMSTCAPSADNPSSSMAMRFIAADLVLTTRPVASRSASASAFFASCVATSSATASSVSSSLAAASSTDVTPGLLNTHNPVHSARSTICALASVW